MMWVTLIGLQGCANMAVTGAQAVYNHHSLQKSFKDQYITLQAYNTINLEDKRFKDTNIAIATLNGEVLLAGEAPEPWQRAQAEKMVKRIPDVRRVYNLVSIASPSSALTRISDAWITTKVKSRLIASSIVDATQVKVVTENGTVFLMGTLPPEQATAAIEVARTTSGVETVVKLFSYIHITKA